MIERMRIRHSLWLPVWLGLLLAGCATVDSLEPGSGSTLEVKGRSYDQVWKAALTAVNKQLTVVAHNKARGEIRAEAKAGLATWGEVVGVFITPTTPKAKQYTVEVVSQKRSKIQVTGQNWERSILSSMAIDLDL